MIHLALNEQYIGKRFGYLTIIERLTIKDKGKSGYVFWKCLCDCGNEKIARLQSLKRGETISCGCRGRSFYNDISGNFLCSLRSSAKRRGLELNLTPEFMWELFLKQNKTCAISGLPLIMDRKNPSKNTASLDRKDSTKGYVTNNVQWVHRIVNTIKWNLTEKEFYDMIKRIYEFRVLGDDKI